MTIILIGLTICCIDGPGEQLPVWTGTHNLRKQTRATIINKEHNDNYTHTSNQHNQRLNDYQTKPGLANT